MCKYDYYMLYQEALNNDVKNVTKIAAAYEALTKQILLESGRKKVRI